VPAPCLPSSNPSRMSCSNAMWTVLRDTPSDAASTLVEAIRVHPKPSGQDRVAQAIIELPGEGPLNDRG
jgi:hypothetical protein